jgi:hypothetical protein
MGDNFWAEAERQRHLAFGRAQRFSDQDTRREVRAQAIFFPAPARFRLAIRDAAAASTLMDEEFRYLSDVLDDHAPSQSCWDDKITGARG